MKLFALGCAIIMIGAGKVPYASGQVGSDPQVALIKRFIRAKYGNDYDAIKKTSLQHRYLKLLLRGSQTPETSEQKDRLNEFMSRIIIQQETAKDKDETRKKFVVNFGGSLIPLDTVKTDDGWKVDAKWWIAMAQPPTEPIQTARFFFYSVIIKHAANIKSLSLPNKELYVLVAGRAPPGGEFAQYHHLCSSMPMIEIGRGEEYIDVRGDVKTHNEKDVLVLQALFGFSGKKLCFMLKRVDKKWRVDSEPFIGLARIKATPESLQSAKNQFETRVLRGLVLNTLNGKGDIDQLRKFIDKSISNELKTTLLNGAFERYWMNNQRGQLKKNSNWIQMITLLIDSGANIEHQDYAGSTLLMRAITYGNGHNRELVELLISKGADVNAKGKEGESILSMAARHKEAYREILIKSGAKP